MKLCIYFKVEYVERIVVLEFLWSNVERYKVKCVIFVGNNKGLEFIFWKLINFLIFCMYLVIVEDVFECK